MSITMPQRLLHRALLIILLALGLVAPGRALAHGGHTGPMQTFTQQFGPYEIAITVEIRAMAIELIMPVAMEKELRFAIREGGRTVGAGVVTEITE